MQQQNDFLDVVAWSRRETKKESQVTQARESIGLFFAQKKTPAQDEQGFQNIELADICHPAWDTEKDSESVAVEIGDQVFVCIP